MNQVVVNTGWLYGHAKKVAKDAVAGSPETSYGLEDVMPAEMWLSVTSSSFVSIIPVHATLDGCIDALRGRGVTGANVERVTPGPPAGSAVTVEDMRVVRSWLADTLVANVDEDGRQEMVNREANDRAWASDPTRVTSLVLAFVVVAGATADR